MRKHGDDTKIKRLTCRTVGESVLVRIDSYARQLGNSDDLAALVALLMGA
jgi:hypothetical protein